MKKILYSLQLSAIDKEGKFLLDKDSNFRVIRNTIKAFEKYCKGKYHHYIIVPEYGHAFKDIESDNIDSICHLDYYTNKVFSSRCHWNSNVARNILLKVKPDIIWENNPSLIVNWKTLLLEEKMLDKVKIIGYNHWIETEEFLKIDSRCSYQPRQAEGYVQSNMMLCNSNEAIRQIKNQYNEIWNSVSNGRRLFKFPPLIDEDEFDINNSCYRNLYNVPVRIIYNHRLSSINYYNDSFLTLLKVLNGLKKRTLKCNVEVILTDASGKIKNRSDIKFKDSSNIKLILKNNLNRKDYLDILKSSNICIGLFKKENGGCWSISLAESIMAGCAVIMPTHSGYGEMIPENSFDSIYDDNDVFYIIELLQELINRPKLRIENNEEKKEFYTNNYNSKKLILELHQRIQEMSNANNKK